MPESAADGAGTERFEPASMTYDSQRLRMHYVDWGNPSAPPLVLLHGGRDHCRNWDALALELRGSWHVIAPDLRGHGESAWSPDGQYRIEGFVYDLAQLVEQLQLAPLTLVGHSLGGNVCVRYAGIYPERVTRLASIEGLGPSPKVMAAQAAVGIAERMRKWIGEQAELARRTSRRYRTLAEAASRMAAEHPRLQAWQVAHLTRHGARRNEDGTYSWKFDNYLRSSPPTDLSRAQIEELWTAVACPALLVYGADSWASNPLIDGRARHFRSAEVVIMEGVGHWLHHERPAEFLGVLRRFLDSAAGPAPGIAAAAAPGLR